MSALATDTGVPSRFGVWRDALLGALSRGRGPLPAETTMREAARLPPPGAEPAARSGSVALVGAGPGSRDLITLRGARLLAEADVVFFDRLADPALLDLARPAAVRVHVGKAPGNTSWPQARINAAIVAAARSGQRVVRLKCGDPGIFGRGAEEAEACRAAGVAWESVPGVTAASVAAAEIGEFLTVRDLIDTVVLTTGHLREEGVDADWARYARPGTTVAVYMGVSTAWRLRDAFLAGGIPPGSEVFVVQRAGFADCVALRATVSTFPDAMISNDVANPAIILLRVPKEPPPDGSPSARMSAAMPAQF